jgi:hypothetical protein
MVSKEITEIEETNKELKFGEKNKTTKQEILSSAKVLLRQTINQEFKNLFIL